MYQRFVQQKTRELAIVLIVTSVVQFLLGFGTLFTNVRYILYSGAPFWGTVCYLIAGTLTLSVRRSPSLCLVKGSLALSILGAIVGCIGIILACLDIVAVTYLKCSNLYLSSCSPPNPGDITVFSIILITNVLLVCVAISLAVFGCKVLSHEPTVPQVYLVQNGVAVPAPASAFPPPTVVFTQSPPSCTVPVEGNSQH
ncbi:membrane-spanning 4-domains subfamily A member 8-like [Dendropsophus ebraccatus]|uniref:membrane-spanning 4-domains subfamily A member 8-like n=1 Tax=Dendropsophus ebraccatus TaxID=150705 RepID=UPI0038320D7F